VHVLFFWSLYFKRHFGRNSKLRYKAVSSYHPSPLWNVPWIAPISATNKYSIGP
jgi:hypothetical protein